MDIKLSAKPNGFTLVELVVVIILLTIISTLFIIRTPSASFSLESSAYQLASHLRYCQILSMTRFEPYHLVKVSANQYSILDSTNTAIAEPVTGKTVIDLGPSVTLTLSNLPNQLVAFNAKGSPFTDSAATVALTSQASMTLTFNGQTKTIAISPATGYLEVS